MPCQRRAFLGTHMNAAHPRGRVVYVAILRRDIEIAQHHETRMRFGFALSASA